MQCCGETTTNIEWPCPEGTHDELRSRLQAALVDAHRPETGSSPSYFPGKDWSGRNWVFSSCWTEPRFADAIRRCDALIWEEAGWSPLTALEASEDSTLLHGDGICAARDLRVANSARGVVAQLGCDAGVRDRA